MKVLDVFITYFIATVHVLAFPEPIPTTYVAVSTALTDHTVVNGTPQPTPMPVSEMVDLRPRQNNQILFATIGTCGYLSGSPDFYFVCQGGAYGLHGACAITMPASGPRRMGCCDGGHSSCNFFTTCIDASQYTSQSICKTSNCESDTAVELCTDAGAPYCMTNTFPDAGILFYDCGATFLPSSTRTAYLSNWSQNSSFPWPAAAATTSVSIPPPDWSVPTSTSSSYPSSSSTPHSQSTWSFSNTGGPLIPVIVAGCAFLVIIFLVCVCWRRCLRCCKPQRRDPSYNNQTVEQTGCVPPPVYHTQYQHQYYPQQSKDFSTAG